MRYHKQKRPRLRDISIHKGTDTTENENNMDKIVERHKNHSDKNMYTNNPKSSHKEM